MTYYELEDDVEALAAAVVGSKIVAVEHGLEGYNKPLELTLDNGKRVTLTGYGDCCAGADVDDFLFNIANADNVITSVTTSEEGEKWFILAGVDEVLGLDVSYSEGSGYYSFGIAVDVKEITNG